MQARHSVISLAALARCIRRSSVVNNMSAPASHSFLYQAVAKVLVLVRRLCAHLLVDELALIAQLLGLGHFGVAQIVVVVRPTKSKNALKARPRLSSKSANRAADRRENAPPRLNTAGLRDDAKSQVNPSAQGARAGSGDRPRWRGQRSQAASLPSSRVLAHWAKLPSGSP